MKNKCIHGVDKKLCVLCKQQKEIHEAYQLLHTTSKETTNVPDLMNREEVLRWYRRSI